MKRILSLYSLIAILIAAGTANLNAQNVAVDKISLSFAAQLSGPAVSQTLNVTSSTGSAINFFAVSNSAWIKVNGQTSASGTTPSSVTVAADPSGLNPGIYQTTVSVFGGSNGSVTVNVTLTVSTIGVSPASIAFSGYTAGSTTVPPPQSITVSGTSTSFTAAASTANGGAWLQVTPTGSNAPGTITAVLNTAIVPGLAVGTYNGKITITPAGTGAIPVDIPVTLTVTAAPVVSVSPSPLQFNIQAGGTNNITSQVLTIGVAPASLLGFGITSSVDPNPAGKNWMLIDPPNGNTNAQTGLAQVTVSVDTTALPANTYNGTITLITPTATPTQTTIPVKLVVSTTPLLNIPAAPVTFTYQLGSATPADKTVNVTATSGTLAYTVAVSANTAWLSATANGSTAAPFAISVNPAGLTTGTYNGSVTVTGVTPGSGTQQIPVVLKVTNDPMIVTNATAMAFPFQIGQATPASQVLKISSSTGALLSFTATPSETTCGTVPWLLVNGSSTAAVSGSTDASLVVSVNPAGIAAGTCTGKITVASTISSSGAPAINSPLEIPVTLYVSSTALLVVTPTLPPAFSVALGATSVAPQTVTLTSTGGAAEPLNYSVAFNTTNGGNWLFVGPLSGSTASSNVLTISVIPSLLSSGTYNGTITISATAAGGGAVANSPLTIPVSLTVSAGSLTLSATSLNFTAMAGGSAPAAQSVTVASTAAALPYTAIAAAATSPSWLSVSPASGITGTTGALTVTANPANLAAGTYNGTVTVTSPGAGNSPAVVNVTLVVQAGTISAPTTTLTFNQAAGGAAPPAQTIAVTGTPGALNFTAAPSANAPWLTVTPASGTTPGSVSVTASAGSLAVGQYTGSVVITSTGAAGSPITVPVVLNVLAPQTLTANPASLTFAYTTGLAAPAAQSVTVTITGTAVPINAVVQATPATPWLAVTPATATSPATFSVSVTPGSLAAGTYNGAISISSANAVTALTIPVTLTVSTVPKPVVNSIGNAASYSTGSISPGENIVIFGTGIGPATLVSGTVTGGVLGNTIGNTRVLFDGTPAPILYASATQTSVLVPYGLNGRTTTNVVVEYSGVPSSAIAYNVAAAAPGIYTLNQQGTGPGAVVNENGTTVNSASAPAARGSVISIYMTGEGQTSPAGSDGAIIPAVESALKKPLLPVTATVNGIDATVLYAGSAPGFVSGAMQVNIRIPDNAPTGGTVPISIKIGSVTTQAGVTIAIQ